MAAGPNRSARWIQTSILYVIAASCVVAPFSSAQCVDGAYKYEGRQCCLCPAGQHLVEHCTENLQKGKCELCQAGTYTSEPTFQATCEPCTSCSHPNANLEEEEPCTPARNRKCRCQQGHYCISGREICILCHPCTQCDRADIKVHCTAYNDTVCNAKNTGGTSAGTIAAVVVAVVVAAVAILVGVFLKMRQRKRNEQSETSTDANDEAMQPLTEMNLFPYLPDIADIIGWNDMEEIAISTNISPVTIDSIQIDYRNNSREQTLHLLRDFNEKHSKEAARKLITMLRRKGKNDKARRVQQLLASPASAAESA